MDLKSILIYFIAKEKLAFSLYLLGLASYFPQHCLYFFPEPHGQASLRPTFLTVLGFFLPVLDVSTLSIGLATCFLSVLCLTSALAINKVTSLSIFINKFSNNSKPSFV